MPRWIQGIPIPLDSIRSNTDELQIIFTGFYFYRKFLYSNRYRGE